MKKPNAIVGYHGYWAVLTYLGLISAAVGICLAIQGHLRYALICLMVSGLCDAFDGRVASLKERSDKEKNYGLQIDALADLVNFGVLPIVIGYSIWQNNRFLLPLHFAVCSMYVLAALIRLAYFNVIEMELEKKNEKRTYYEGLPVTSAALIIPFVFSLCDLFALPFQHIYLCLLFALACLFVLRIRIPKPRTRGIVFLCLPGLPAVIYIFIGGR